MNKTKIEWCDSTWNPVTGCLHGCEYCYARRIAERFGTLFKGDIMPEDEGLTFLPDEPNRFYELDEPARNDNGKLEPFPVNFYPTFHRYRLDEPQHMKKPQTIFVCSMADLFGDWVPYSWIEEVLRPVRKRRSTGICSLLKTQQDTASWPCLGNYQHQITIGMAALSRTQTSHFGTVVRITHF